MSRRLIALGISPWSERAKWALDHHRLEVQLDPHMPFLGEARIRRLSRAANKPRATVPILVDGDKVLVESWDIVRWADEVGQREKLIPADLEPAIRAYQEKVDALMSVGRALVVAATLVDDEALDANLPVRLPRPVAAVIRPSMRTATRWFAKKYGLDLMAREEHLQVMRAGLSKTRQELEAAGRYVLGRFSYADILLATSLQGVRPVADAHWRIPPGTRRAWTRTELAAEFEDLLAWRDRIYEEHRR